MAKVKNAYIVGAGKRDYYNMFASESGFDAINEPDKADIFVFTGGEDVDPARYGEKVHPRTYFNPRRDEFEIELFKNLPDNIVKVGICRGGQLLNVLNHGTLWQDVDYHTTGIGHMLTDVQTQKQFRVTSSHHQMMRPHEDGIVLAVARESTCKQAMPDQWSTFTDGTVDDDVEAVWYPTTKSLCFQPHPEYHSAFQTRGYFFELLNRYMR